MQQLGNYFRVRHYQGIDKNSGKSKFYYHQQTPDYASRQIALIGKGENFIAETNNIGQSKAEYREIEQLNTVQEPNLKDSSLISSGRRLVWFRTQAFQACDHGFESRRPHQNRDFSWIF
jgi:hypothetical protein